MYWKDDRGEVMEEFSFKFGTPKPISFREKLNTDYLDFDLEARMAGTVTVTDYPENVYGSKEELITTLKVKMLDIAKICLDKMSEHSVMLHNTTKRLGELMTSELKGLGISAGVEMFNFVLTSDSRELYDEQWKYYQESRNRYVDMTDRPCQDYLEKFGILQNYLEKSGMMDGDYMTYKGTNPSMWEQGMRDAMMKEGKLCPKCGAKSLEGAKFCSECGAKF